MNTGLQGAASALLRVGLLVSVTTGAAPPASPQLQTQTGGDCGTLQPAARRELFRATRVLNFHVNDAQLVARLSCLLQQMQADGTALPEDYRHLHGALLAQRCFEAANALRKEHHLDVPLLPAIEGATGDARQVLRLHGAARAERVTLPVDGWQLIALVHPWCGPSRRATTALVSDPALADLRPRLQLVVPDSQDWPLQDMLAWNSAHPDLPMQPVLPSAAWQGVDFSTTPQFILLRDGVQVERAVGWVGTGEELRPLLQRMRATE